MWSLFHHYASLGDPTGANMLSLTQYRHFCRDARVIAPRNASVSQDRAWARDVDNTAHFCTSV